MSPTAIVKATTIVHYCFDVVPAPFYFSFHANRIFARLSYGDEIKMELLVDRFVRVFIMIYLLSHLYFMDFNIHYFFKEKNELHFRCVFL